MALHILTFTTAALPIPSKIFNHSIQPRSSLHLHFSKAISTRHFSVHHSSTQPQKYVYPDPIPEFAVAETQKFKAELLKKLFKEKEIFGDELDDVVSVCAEIFNEFLHKEYGGPGTLLVEPFTDMMVALKERKLPGAALAARASLLWAQNYVDQDWETWNSKRLRQ
ncbi:PREDICTED: protein PLASTID REDOX INSENSITIVE 2-like [Nicotiana attenuata]|uniref:protein PLASTID REDOX INSENSITIVE 2-like n=1 Tax=Nicotiana attenuata TaxID=49451 RepID=UPI0009046EA1|nr:PREDICTED: protein PLASTID REDOX INSENSITIVE 2-like [Nicotiana attenuata]